MNIASLLAKLSNDLPGESPMLDAQVLLAHITRHNRAWVLAHPEAQLDSAGTTTLEAAARRLKDGEPLPYVVGRWEFFGLDFEVTPDVLIPRPETELLVETALDWVRTQPQLDYRFVDVGTGSGCIAVSLAFHVPRAQITATDISPAALAVAQRNAQRNAVEERINFVECDLLPTQINLGEDLTNNLTFENWNLVTANLPYIPSETLKGLGVYGREPTLALDGGPDGLEIIRRLLARLTASMDAGSLILLEIEHRQGALVRSIAVDAFPAADVQLKKDLAGNDRLIAIEI